MTFSCRPVQAFIAFGAANLGRKQGQAQGPASARDYLELHGVLKYACASKTLAGIAQMLKGDFARSLQDWRADSVEEQVSMISGSLASPVAGGSVVGHAEALVRFKVFMSEECHLVERCGNAAAYRSNAALYCQCVAWICKPEQA